MPENLYDAELWRPALEKYAEVTGLSVELFGAGERLLLTTVHPSPMTDLFRKYGFEPGLFADCAHRCMQQTGERPPVTVASANGLTVVGASLALEDTIVGAAVAGYAFAGFSQVGTVQRWAKSSGMPFESLWSIARRLQPVPERRLLLHGELLQILGDSLLREHHRTRQYEVAVANLESAVAAKEEFLAVVSHELRTPLAPILGWASVLKKDQSPEQVRRAAEVIERNVLLQTRMVDDLLYMNMTARGMIKLDHGVHELGACVGTALEALAREIDKKAIRLVFAGAAEPLFVSADSGRLQQIFMNIISNAVKFTPERGAIRVVITGESGTAKVTVTDTGVGIEPAFLPFVFDMFRQQDSGTRRKYTGLGIGLALVKKLTEMHQGTISVTSAGTGHGTEVAVQFPLAAAPDSPETKAPGVRLPAKSLAGLSLLVVDDVEDARESLRILLQHLGANVTVASGGREGLNMARDHEPDLVLCDLRMPRMDGFEFIRELHRDTSSAHLPVVAVTALASDADREQTREAGFEGHINKPFDEAAIVAAVDAALHPHGGNAAIAGAGGGT